MKAVALTWILLISASVSFGCDFIRVHIGIAGPSGGTGIGGHSFLVFSKNNSNLLNSVILQYNIFKSNDQREDAFFGVSKEIGLQFIEEYRKQDRTILLYELNLNDEQICDIYSSIEREREQRFEKKILDYNIINNNCLSNLTEKVNRVVINEEMKLQETGKFSLLLALSDISFNIPSLIVSELSNHRLIKGPPIVFLSTKYDEIKINILMEELIYKVFRCKSEIEKETYRKISLNTQLRQTKSFLNEIRSAAKLDQEIREDALYLYDLIYFSSGSTENRKVINSFSSSLRDQE
jgi:hypothetical protein